MVSDHSAAWILLCRSLSCPQLSGNWSRRGKVRAYRHSWIQRRPRDFNSRRSAELGSDRELMRLILRLDLVLHTHKIVRTFLSVEHEFLAVDRILAKKSYSQTQPIFQSAAMSTSKPAVTGSIPFHKYYTSSDVISFGITKEKMLNSIVLVTERF